MNLPDLSVIITSHSEPDLENTVTSLRTTAPEVEIIVVDDASIKPVVIENTLPTSLLRVIRTERRIGVGPARTLGIIAAKGEYIMLTDSHMRFRPGWYESTMSVIAKAERRDTLHCGIMLGLEESNTSMVTPPGGRYYGATWNFYGPDANIPGRKQVFECVWNRNMPDKEAEIPACMGACYFAHRHYFMTLNPLRYLRSWGGDEQAMSLKYWLMGDGVRLLGVEFGHIFRDKKRRVPFPISEAETIYNKLFLIHTLLPTDLAPLLTKRFHRGGAYNAANTQILDDWHIIEYERARNALLMEEADLSFQDFLAKFQLPFPTS